MLGGGHGFLQGYYGTLADNLVEAEIVLANGDMVTVSDDTNADLFWGLRGAGHNLGIVSNYRYRVFDHPNEKKWSFTQFTFLENQLEDLYNGINNISGGKMHPAELVYLATWMNIPEIDPKNVSHPHLPTSICILHIIAINHIHDRPSSSFQ
jgi:FAD/FMN-containing dehydrogenase